MKSKPFFITGLPRSRTAWLSAFMSNGRNICYHEPIYKMRDIEDIKQFYDCEYYNHVGVSDSGLGFFVDWILDNIGAKTVIVDRDINEVEASLKQLGLPASDYLEQLYKKLQSVRNHPLVLWIPFEALSEKRVVQKIYWHLMQGESFDEARYEEFNKMNIELKVVEGIERARGGHDNISHLMRDFTFSLKDAQHETM